MSLLTRIVKNLTAAEYKIVKKSIFFRLLEAIAVSAQTFILLAAVNYIYMGGTDVWYFISYSALIFLIFLIRRYLAFSSMSELFSAAYNVGFKIRKNLLLHMIKMPLGALSELHIGKISQTLSEDISWIEDLISFVGPASIANIFNSIFLVFTVFLIDWRMGIVVFVCLFAALTILYIIKRRSSRNLKTRSMDLSDASLRTVEFVHGMPILRAFGGFDKANDSYQKSIENLRMGFIKVNKLAAKFFSLFFFAMDSAVAFSILFAGYLFAGGSAEPKYILAALVVILAALVPLRGAIAFIVVGNLAQIAHENLAEVERHKAMDIAAKPVEFSGHDIQFNNVSFAYNDLGSVLKDVSFKAAANSMTAIVGPSGGGKTTIINLVARFWDVQHGSIKIGGQDIKELPLEELLSQISLVMQDVKLFNQSIYDNIAVGRVNASKDEIVKAAKSAQAHEFIMALPDGYDTQVGEGGARLSGGERQRISIARAILKDSPIILLDEATSAIDPENELAIQHAIGELTHNKTLIVIAHRLSTIVDADQIIVMDDGQVNAIGQHDDLLEKSELYKKLWNYHTNISGWKI